MCQKMNKNQQQNKTTVERMDKKEQQQLVPKKE
jgi:hypothetical protein